MQNLDLVLSWPASAIETVFNSALKDSTSYVNHVVVSENKKFQCFYSSFVI